AWPVESPIGDAEQGAACAVGEYGVRVHRFADVMGVGDDADSVHLDGNREVVGGLKSGGAWRNVDAVGAQRDVDQAARGWLGGKVEGKPGTVGFGLAGGVVVDLEDE